VVALQRAAGELAHPAALAVLRRPRRDGLVEAVQLHAALALAGPDVGQRAAELGVPQQRRQVVDRDDHADMVDRAVGHGLDGAVGDRAPAKEPHVAGLRRGDGLVERERVVGFDRHGP
jgi:hypothetical protein